MFLLMWKCLGVGNTIQVLRKVPFPSACINRLRRVCIQNRAWFLRTAEPPLGFLPLLKSDMFTHLQNRITKVIRHGLTIWPIFVHIFPLSFLSADRTAFQSHSLGRSRVGVGVTEQTDLIPPRLYNNSKTCFYRCNCCAGDKSTSSHHGLAVVAVPAFPWSHNTEWGHVSAQSTDICSDGITQGLSEWIHGSPWHPNSC